MPSPICKDGDYPPIGERLDPLRCHVAVLRSVGHHDEKLCGLAFDDVLPPVQRASVEHDGALGLVAGRVHGHMMPSDFELGDRPGGRSWGACVEVRGAPALRPTMLS